MIKPSYQIAGSARGQYEANRVLKGYPLIPRKKKEVRRADLQSS